MDDFREGHEAGRIINDNDVAEYVRNNPQQYSLDDVEVKYQRMDVGEENEEAFDGWLKWVFDELVNEKIPNVQFRNKTIIMRGMQWVNYDIDLDVESVDGAIIVCVYTPLRNRNSISRPPDRNTYSRTNFSVGDGMWDEVAHLL